MQKLKLSGSVGAGGDNHPEDVKSLQHALNQLAEQIGLSKPLNEDGLIGEEPSQSQTCSAIGLFQATKLGFKNPDQKIDCGGKTHQALSDALCVADDHYIPWRFLANITPDTGLNDDDFATAAEQIGCDVAAIKAVSKVETAGSGFFSNGLPCILFEAHQFSRLTHHQYDQSYPDISALHWDRSLYLGGEKEYQRLEQAIHLDQSAALQAASYGRYQIMGFNFKSAGYGSVQDFVRDMFLAESHHLMAFVHFIQSVPEMAKALIAHDWATFARHYNGPAYAQNHYDKKLEKAYEQYQI
ncbi:MAG: hypothetical protein CENE_01208 [Candidatus Celerinatantimonas neptuna]|nr:MAG: hypothetical protein CENE_01208 [Candidatus Celerinatantimonas neptuna]